MSALGKRLDTLEAIAEEMRLRPFRELAEERGISLDDLMERYAECQAQTARRRAEGWTDEQLIADAAERTGHRVEEFRAEVDRLLERYGGCARPPSRRGQAAWQAANRAVTIVEYTGEPFERGPRRHHL